MRIVQCDVQSYRICIFDQEITFPRNHAHVRSRFGTHRFSGLSQTVEMMFSLGNMRLVQYVSQSYEI